MFSIQGVVAVAIEGEVPGSAMAVAAEARNDFSYNPQPFQWRGGPYPLPRLYGVIPDETFYLFTHEIMRNAEMYDQLTAEHFLQRGVRADEARGADRAVYTSALRNPS